eukprot:m.321725 g.321725  ORF g.321725 m.321725 type:complete len:128 (-) comp25783_c0_seq1:20-403(-)
MSHTLQDRPPPGGFKDIPFKRNLPYRGPSGVVLFAAGALAISFGFYKIIDGNQHRRRLKAETINARIALAPFLQAEEDRRVVRMQFQHQLGEKEIMEGVKGWNAQDRPFHTDRFVPPRESLNIPRSP